MQKKRMISGAVLVILAVAGFVYYKSVSDAVTYKKHIIQKGDIQISILATGTVQPQNRLEIKSPIAGRIEEILVDIGDVVRKGQILAWLSSTERAALLDAARAKGADEVTRWKEIYKPTPIVAPIAGMIILRNVESGQTFTTTDAVLVMSNRLTVKAQVDETDLAQIKLQQNAEIRLDAYPDQVIPAAVEQIAFEAKAVNNVTTYIITVLPKETPSFMRSGMTANVTFSVDSKKEILLMPTEFIKYENGKSLVLVEDEKNKNAEKEIKLGVTDGKNSEILEGVLENETILLVKIKKDEKGKASSPFSPMGGGRGGRRK